MDARKYHHPRFDEDVVLGRRLGPGELRKTGDVYDSISGWQSISGKAVGTPVPENAEMIFIRPA